RKLTAQLRRNHRAEPKRPPHGPKESMKQAAPRASMGTRIVRTALLTFCGLAILVLPACRCGPPPAEYILGTMPEATATSVAATGLPLVEVKRVQLPDY